MKSTQGLLKSINNVSRAISISESLDEYLELTANSIMNSFQVRTVTIWKADYDADEISLISAAGLPSNWRSGAYVTQPIGRGQVVASSVPQDGKTIYINNTQQENAVDLFDPAAKSILSIPIYVKGTTLGVLQVTNHKAHAFNKDAIKTLESLAAQIGLAMLEETQLTTPNVTTSTSQSNENIDWLMFEGTLDSVIVLDKDKTVAYINNAALHTFNLQDQMVIGQTIQALNEPQLLDIVGKVNMKSRPNYQGAIDLSGQLTDVSIAPRYNSTGNGTVISTSSNGWIMTLRPQNQVEMIKQPVTNGAAVDPELARELTTRVQNLDKLVTMLPSLGDLAPTQEEAVNRISQLNFDLSGIAEKLSSGQRKTNHNDGSNNLNGKNGANGAVAVALETSTERSALLNTIQAGVGEKESVNVASILADVIKRVSEDANQQQKTIQPDIANDLPLLYCNEKQIHQAISELVDNAIKYCPPKTKIRLVAGLDQDQIILAVRDNGKGIWLKDTPMLFEPGFRVENEETQAVSGEGLGLTIVKVIAENHGGRAIVETRVGRGSIFLLKLPNA
ncbi:MAG: ATP-binding protein [Chloroflexota bacterium]